MNKLNLAIIGYGGMGSHHVDTIIPKDSELFEVVGAYDIKESRRKAAVKDGLKAYESLEELLADEAIDAVVIATPNDSHKELSVESLKAGKHVICEKPVTMNTKEFDEIIAQAEKEGRVFMVHQNRRWDPDFLLVKDLFEEKTIGDIFQIESRVHGANGIPGDWRHIKEQGGGMLLDWGVHLIDQVMYLIDRPIIDIKVDMSYILGNEVDDGFFLYLTFDNGIRVTVEVGTTNYLDLPRWYVKGNKGTARIDDWDLTGEMIVPVEHNIREKPSPIKAGAGLTKTMAPPVNGTVERRKLAAPNLDYPSFYQNFYEVVVEEKEAIVKNEEVREVMLLIDKLFDQIEKQKQL
ncbi:MAG: Gfo/Idh/MocA family oxidoreductase [Atopostipes sp.]|nr:Gfo/Idh/MocA family oxidoreductase [Atopostipes sp.]